MKPPFWLQILTASLKVAGAKYLRNLSPTLVQPSESAAEAEATIKATKAKHEEKDMIGS